MADELELDVDSIISRLLAGTLNLAKFLTDEGTLKRVFGC